VETAPDDRPKKAASGSQTRQRTKQAAMPCTPKERAEIEAKAARAGLTVAGYLRALAFGKDTPQPRAARRPPLEKQELIALRYELRKIGGNLNQTAHHLNQGQGLDAQSRAVLHAALAEHRAALAAILAALGQDAPATPEQHNRLAGKLFGRGRAA
jgi:hypothetical protein